ncbi:MAG: D-alanyl-D-alanine carboxypeptidase [Firmicutes bacterium]|nr:D-alanyl-D-alanine carboxypeptidase [Bacillota bacterium]
MRKKMLLMLVLSFLIVIFAAANTFAQDFNFASKAQLLMETNSGKILYEHNIHEKLYPASVTKIMTMLLAMEALEEGKVKLDDLIPVSEKAAGLGGSQLFLAPGDRISFAEMMIGIGAGSANDASWAMKIKKREATEVFVARMNERAQELGMVNTNFVNPHGLHDENHYTTASDIAKMSLELLRHPKIHEWITIWYDEEFLQGKIKKREGVYLSNSNQIIRYYEGGDGLKTGFTREAANCVSATAAREGTRFLAVILGAPGRPALFAEARTLLDYGFANWRSLPVTEQGEVLGRVKVDKGTVAEIEFVAKESYALLVRKGMKDKVTHEIIIPIRLTAPLERTTQIGTLLVKSAEGEELGRVALVPAADVQRANIITFLRRFVGHWLRFGR